MIRPESRTSENVWSSLQPVTDVDQCRLESLQSSTGGKKLKDVLHGLLEVLNFLCMDIHSCHYSEQSKPSQSRGFLPFQEVFEIFSGHLAHNTDMEVFEQHLLHPAHGLPVNIVTLPFYPYRLIILKSSLLDTPELISLIVRSQDQQRNEQVQHFKLRDC